MTFKHVIIRLYLYFLLFLFFITGGLAMFIFAPLYKFAFAPNAEWGSLKPFSTWRHVWRIMWRSLSSRKYRSLYPSKITDPPEFENNGKNSEKMQIKASWQGDENNCDKCENSCCAQISCPMLDKQGRCLSYGSIYFGYLYCGRYPSNQGQVDLYNCPKWEVQS
ncbi:MAG: hypothetical protein LBC86_06800 [Oscillospiraceae bacterium]|jgi:hypothetical protein|nr:hypothetical protein [Oscillospiraceae bacterium]